MTITRSLRDRKPDNDLLYILDLHVGHVGGEAQKNILSILLWAPASVGEKHCLVCPTRLVASQELITARTTLPPYLNMDHSPIRQTSELGKLITNH